MPKYKFQCENCKGQFEYKMKITEFLKFKKESAKCSNCKEGYLLQIVRPSHGKIVRDKEYIIQEAKEEAKEIVGKIRAGDEKAFTDIYGDRENPHKNT